MVTKDEAQTRFQRYVAVRVAGNADELRGKVLEVGNDAFVLQTKTDTRVIQFRDTESIIERRRGVTIRRLRIVKENDSVRQHLADRHAIFVSVLKAVDEETCHSLHDKINHHDLGHTHVNPDDAMAVLDELHDNEGAV